MSLLVSIPSSVLCPLYFRETRTRFYDLYDMYGLHLG